MLVNWPQLCIYALMNVSVSLFVYGLCIKMLFRKQMRYGSRFQTVSSITLTFPIIKNFANNKPNMLRWTLNTHRNTHLKELFLFVCFYLCCVCVFNCFSLRVDYSIFCPIQEETRHASLGVKSIALRTNDDNNHIAPWQRRCFCVLHQFHSTHSVI